MSRQCESEATMGYWHSSWLIHITLSDLVGSTLIGRLTENIRMFLRGTDVKIPCLSAQTRQGEKGAPRISNPGGVQNHAHAAWHRDTCRFAVNEASNIWIALQFSFIELWLRSTPCRLFHSGHHGRHRNANRPFAAREHQQEY